MEGSTKIFGFLRGWEVIIDDSQNRPHSFWKNSLAEKIRSPNRDFWESWLTWSLAVTVGYGWLVTVGWVGWVGWVGYLGGDDSRGHSAVAFVIPEFLGLGDFLVRNVGGWGDFHEMMGRQTWLYKYTPENYEFTPAKRGSKRFSFWLAHIFLRRVWFNHQLVDSSFFFEVIKPQLGNFPVQWRCPSDLLHMAISWASAPPRRPTTRGKCCRGFVVVFSPAKTTVSGCKAGPKNQLFK